MNTSRSLSLSALCALSIALSAPVKAQQIAPQPEQTAQPVQLVPVTTPQAEQAQPKAQAIPLPAGTPLPPPTLPYPDEQPPEYSDKDKAALALSQTWKAAPTIPTAGANGKVSYIFGETLPSVICVPLQITDVELEPGEVVKQDGLHLGDTIRWSVLPAVSGPEGSATTHLIIKPQAPNLTTSLTVATDRRMYHIRLVSTEKAADWMPYIGFNYPEADRARWAAYQQQQQRTKDRNTLPNAAGPGSAGVSLGALDFNYTIKGDAPWCPIRVYNDGVKTVIQMPKAMAQTEAPALLVIGADKKEQLVNYRVHGDRYIIDQLFSKAELISGVGRKQVKVTISRVGPASTENDTAGIQHKR